jgi:transcriptional regulator with XRE-family HTH domain
MCSRLEEMQNMKSRRSGPARPFQKILEALMREKGVGVREAAKLAGVGPSTVMSWKSGSAPADYVAVKRLANALGTTLCFLLTGEKDVPPEGTRAPLSEVLRADGLLYDGYAKVTIEKLVIRDDLRDPTEKLKP